MTIYVGETVTLKCKFLDENGDEASNVSDVSLTVIAPDGTKYENLSPSLVEGSTATFYYNIDVNQSGTWRHIWSAIVNGKRVIGQRKFKVLSI